MATREIAEWFADKENLEAFCNELAELTRNNYHTERYIKIAEKFGFKDLVRKFRNIDAVHTDMGYLCDDLLQYRSKLGKAMYGRIMWYYGQELGDIINLA